jgi:peptidoglycan/xylan/chitin deacetylase (PgdA/CDA1 family)
MNVVTWKRSVLNLCGSLMTDCYRPPAGVLLPCCHLVGDVAPLHVKHLFRIPSVTKLKADIDFLAQNYHPLTLSELRRLGDRDQEKRRAKYFVLSFDDGMREVYEIIAPVLRAKGVPAIFFLNSTTIDNKELMWRHKVSLLVARAERQPKRIPPQLKGCSGKSTGDKLLSLQFADRHVVDELAAYFEVDFDEYLHTSQPYLTTEQIVGLARQGFEFGAHSANHPYFNEISVEQQKSEIHDSVHFIQALGLSCHYFAFPFHDKGVPLSVFQYMRDLGLVFSFGTNDARVDSVHFSWQRFALDADNSDLTIPQILDQLSAKSLALRLSRSEVIHRN